jgi:putative hydrolase of the HAD superfamily
MRRTVDRDRYDWRMHNRLICLDADDTLWHNMRHFDVAEKVFFSVMAPFASEQLARARLETVSQRNLAIYGYGAKSFTLSMIETAHELCSPAVSSVLLGAILEAGRELLLHRVELLPGVEGAIEELADLGELVLVTKGDLRHQEAKFAASGLGDHFVAVEIVSDKSADIFKAICRRHGVAPNRCVMAGDSVRSDIIPALEAGAWAAHVPHEIVWFHERAVAPENHPRFVQLSSLSELPRWVRTLP